MGNESPTSSDSNGTSDSVSSTSDLDSSSTEEQCDVAQNKKRKFFYSRSSQWKQKTEKKSTAGKTFMYRGMKREPNKKVFCPDGAHLNSSREQLSLDSSPRNHLSMSENVLTEYDLISPEALGEYSKFNIIFTIHLLYKNCVAYREPKKRCYK
jgi:hypothetical protein